MSDTIERHLDRIRAATTSKLGRKDLPQWIERNTFLNGRPFSFKGHEYQHRILLEDSPEVVIRKSAQTGISEMAMRMALGLVMIMPGTFRIGYTMPTAHFAASYSKTRFNPIIQQSPVLRSAVSADDIDSAETKTFGPGKEIYFKGAAVGNAAISTSLDMLIHDEVSFSSQEVLGDYSSRIIHSPYKWRFALSTPTFIGDPIDQAFSNSRRHWSFCRCQHCSHRFIPDYYTNVRVPGWGKPLDEIDDNNLHLINYKGATFHCPQCWKPTSLMPEFREWVCENPGEAHIATGFQVQPFDAPTVVTIPDLIIASTKYASKTKFRQFALGRPSEDSETGLTDEDMERIGVTLAQTPFNTHTIGIDLGLTCHFMVGGMDNNGHLGVVHMERVPLSRFRERYYQLCTEYRVTIKVSDIQPYSDLVMALSAEDPNIYGASYVTRLGMEVFDVKAKEADPNAALAGVRQVQVNRGAAFDKLLADIRNQKIWVRKTDEWEVFKRHAMDMKRASAALRNGEMTSVWQKSAKGADHYFHSLNYLSIASQMRGIASLVAPVGIGVSTFKLKGTEARRAAGGLLLGR